MSDTPPKRPVGRPSDSEKHFAILEATGDIVCTYGLAALSMEGVAKAAGVAKGTVYKKFSSKEALIRAYVEHHTNSLPELPETPHENDPLEYLERFGFWLLRLVTRDFVLRFDNAVAAAAPQYPEIARQVHEAGTERATEALAQALGRAAAAGLYHSRDVLEEAETLLGLWGSGLYERARMHGHCDWSDESISEHIVRKTQLFLRAYSTKP